MNMDLSKIESPSYHEKETLLSVRNTCRYG